LEQTVEIGVKKNGGIVIKPKASYCKKRRETKEKIKWKW
jgi:hypothetical protein